MAKLKHAQENGKIRDALAFAIRCAKRTSRERKSSGLKILAKALKVSEASILGVKYGHRPIPSRWCPVIERITAHAIHCEELRPDIDWTVVLDRK